MEMRAIAKIENFFFRCCCNNGRECVATEVTLHHRTQKKKFRRYFDSFDSVLVGKWMKRMPQIKIYSHLQLHLSGISKELGMLLREMKIEWELNIVSALLSKVAKSAFTCSL